VWSNYSIHKKEIAMTITSSNKAKVAIIGIGNIGTVLAENLVKGNRAFILADRKIEKTLTLSQKLGHLAKPMEIEAAIKEADIVVFAVWFSAIKELFDNYAFQLQGKIIIDPSNPIAPDDKGGFKKVIGQEESAGSAVAEESLRVGEAGAEVDGSGVLFDLAFNRFDAAWVGIAAAVCQGEVNLATALVG